MDKPTTDKRESSEDYMNRVEKGFEKLSQTPPPAAEPKCERCGLAITDDFNHEPSELGDCVLVRPATEPAESEKEMLASRVKARGKIEKGLQGLSRKDHPSDGEWHFWMVGYSYGYGDGRDYRSPTALPEAKALEDAKAYRKELIQQAREFMEDADWYNDPDEYAADFALKLLAERDKQTVEAAENLISEFEHYRVLGDPDDADEAEVSKTIQEMRDAINARA